MENPFESDVMDEADLFAESADAELQPQQGDFGDEAFDESEDSAQAFASDESFDAMETADGDAFSDEGGDMAVWNAFEEEIADGLDAADEDEFLGRLLGGLGRAAGVVGRGMGQASNVAGQVGGFARQVGRIAGQAGRVAGQVTPAAMAAARLARMLGAPGVAGALGQVGRVAQGAQTASRQVRRLSGATGQMAGGAQNLFGQLSQLLGQLGQSFDESDAFDAAADWFIEDGVDEALPAVVALAARNVARGLGLNGIEQLSQAARRSLVRGVAAAARELVQRAGPQAVRALPHLAASATRVAARRSPGVPRTVQALRRGLPQAARRLAQNPQAVRRLARPAGSGAASTTAPLARPRNVGRGRPDTRITGKRTFEIDGPVTLTITPR